VTATRIELFERAAARDAVAWLRLLLNPADAPAVVRVLGRPPIELRRIDIARIVKLARRRNLDLIAALGPAGESPGMPPESRERIERFAALHAEAKAAFDEWRGRVNGNLSELATGLSRAADARLLEGGAENEAGADALGETLKAMREEVLGGAERIAGRLGEMRLDTDFDVSHGVVRYLELVKLAALEDRPAGQGLGEALQDINQRLLAACTPMQREIFESSTLDEALLAGERSVELAGREEPSLRAFLPRKGQGVVLSASDIDSYRACPLRYKFGRVLRVPTEQTLHQRFGIAVHQVLERYHTAGHEELADMMGLLEACWRRGGFGDSDPERELHAKARSALGRYHERLAAHEATPVFFERAFSCTIGPHHVRGRVDRVDELPSGGHELIDYKTSRPKSEEQLRGDVQLALYALAASCSWEDVKPERLSYYYVLDDKKVPVPRDRIDPDWITAVVEEVGAAILAERFDPTPSPTVCAMCDYRIACPAGDL
jgi:RecB family exonuclease